MTNAEKKDFLLMQQENLALKHKMVTDELQGVEQAIQAEAAAVAEKAAAEAEKR